MAYFHTLIERSLSEMSNPGALWGGICCLSLKCVCVCVCVFECAQVCLCLCVCVHFPCVGV